MPAKTDTLFGSESSTGPEGWGKAEAAFELARIKYRSECNAAGLRGHDTEWADFRKHHEDAADVAPLLIDCLTVIQANRQRSAQRKEFVSPWPHWSTFQHQRRWEEGLQEPVDPRKAQRAKAKAQARPTPPEKPIRAVTAEEKAQIRRDYEEKTGKTIIRARPETGVATDPGVQADAPPAQDQGPV